MKTLPALLLACTLAAAPIFAQEAAPPVAKARAKVEATDVTPDEAEKLIAENPGLIIIDVRTPEEFEHEHIKGAVNLNVFENGFAEQVAALDQTKPVLVHCQAGTRSSQALMDLAGKVKFPKVYHLRTGFKGWKDAKKPFEGKPLPGVGRLGPGNKSAPGTPAK
jgi:rhodanese-related sulfurtransferase